MKVSALQLCLVAAVGTTMAMASAPAFARHDAAQQQTDVDGMGKVTFDPATQKYCFNKTMTNDAEITGSMLPHTECKTQAQWAAQGVTISRK